MGEPRRLRLGGRELCFMGEVSVKLFLKGFQSPSVHFLHKAATAWVEESTSLDDLSLIRPPPDCRAIYFQPEGNLSRLHSYVPISHKIHPSNVVMLTRSMKVLHGIWHQATHYRYLRTFKFQDRAFMDWTCFLAHPTGGWMLSEWDSESKSKTHL